MSFSFADGTPVPGTTLAAVVLNGGQSGNRDLSIHVSINGVSSALSSNDVNGDCGKIDLPQIVRTREFHRVLSTMRAASSAHASMVHIRDLLAACAEQNIPQAEALALLRTAHAAGIVQHFYGEPSLHNVVFLDPAATGWAFTDYVQRTKHHTPAAVESVRVQLDAMHETHRRLAAKAHRHATGVLWLGFGGVLAQLVGIARLTWWEFSWDIMEPISYCASAFQGLVLYSFYQILKRSPDSKVSVREFLYSRKMARLVAKASFDVAAYEALQNTYARMIHGEPDTSLQLVEYVARDLQADAEEAEKRTAGSKQPPAAPRPAAK